MASVAITVQGRAHDRITPSRATARVSSRADGKDRADVVARVQRGAEQIAAAVGEADAASWSSGSVRSWTERPWNPDGRRQPIVVHAVIDFELRLDRATASTVIGLLLTIDDVTVDGIVWTADDEVLRTAMEEVRRRAIHDGTEKARVYAQTLELSAPQATAVADAGMLDGSAGSPPAPPGLMRAMSAAPSPGGLELNPAPIEIEAVVDLRFTAESGR